MAGSGGAFRERVVISGLRETTSALRKIDRKLPKLVTDELKKAAEPVGPKAEELAHSRIRKITDRWAGMRIGATGRQVYVVPAARRAGGSPRPNLGQLLLDEAMGPAVETLLPVITTRVEEALDRITAEF